MEGVYEPQYTTVGVGQHFMIHVDHLVSALPMSSYYFVLPFILNKAHHQISHLKG